MPWVAKVAAISTAFVGVNVAMTAAPRLHHEEDIYRGSGCPQSRSVFLMPVTTVKGLIRPPPEQK